MSVYKYSLKYILLFLVLVISTTGCAVKAKVYNINSSLTITDVVTYILDANPPYCSYRGKVAVNIGTVNGDSKSFTGLLNKDCNNDTILSVLGPFNVPVAEISYKNKKIEIKTSSNEQTSDIKNIADESVFQIINFLKVPFNFPNSVNYTIKYGKKAYIFTDKIDNFIQADENFKIVRVKYGEIILDYVWEENTVKEILVRSGDIYLKARFFTENGWKLNKNKSENVK